MKKRFWASLASVSIIGSWAFYQEKTPKPISLTLTDKSMVSESSGWFKFTSSVPFKSVPVPFHLLFIDDSCQIARAYSPLRLSDKECQVLIKRYPHGSLSTRIHNLSLGDSIAVLGPFSTVQLPKTYSHIGMVTGY
jgi:NAD(P)H-flavin reductase